MNETFSAARRCPECAGALEYGRFFLSQTAWGHLFFGLNHGHLFFRPDPPTKEKREPVLLCDKERGGWKCSACGLLMIIGAKADALSAPKEDA
ncbi:MAG TPA: hypothetical protein VG796_02960 [Verrucomicrobiales bacterium]|nr:hypothetical protein [Verrucomicrobiales bacterium]